MDGEDSSRGRNRLNDVAPTPQGTKGEEKVIITHYSHGPAVSITPVLTYTSEHHTCVTVDQWVSYLNGHNTVSISPV